MPKYQGNVLGRRMLSRVFGKKVGRPDAECWTLERFVRDTMTGCGWDCRDVHDFWAFNKEFLGFTKPWKIDAWQRWLETSDPEAGIWCVAEKQDGKSVWAVFTKGLRTTDWTPV